LQEVAAVVVEILREAAGAIAVSLGSLRLLQALALKTKLLLPLDYPPEIAFS
jgi:acetylornithine/succinyldiaminopimelate/putrescine aminotransferase